MTYVEFYDKDLLQNVCSALLRVPDRVVLLGKNPKILARHAARYEELMRRRGYEVPFFSRAVNVNSMESVLAVLNELVETFDDCVFDVTGGNELLLVGIGIVAGAHPEKNVQLHRVSIRSGSALDCDMDGNVISSVELPRLSIPELVFLFGGTVRYNADIPNGTPLWDMNDEFCDDLDTMWEICRRQLHAWNSLINVLQLVESSGSRTEDGLGFMADAPQVWAKYNGREQPDALRSILRELRDARILNAFSMNEQYLFVSYKNEQIMRCMAASGRILEMKVFLAALELQNDPDGYVYSDVMTGVLLDWYDEMEDGVSLQATNEVDVMLMHGLTPVFISCKNGAFTSDELFKLKAVAERFGGENAKRVLIASSMENADSVTSLQKRAEELNIRVVGDMGNKSNSEFYRIVKSLWC